MNNNNRLIVNMEVEEPLHDIVTDEFTSVVFECKVSDCSRRCISCEWYKDGKQIEDSRRIKMSYDGKWHRLEITSVTYKDYGVYIIMLHSDCNKIFSKANLYVREIKDKHYNDVLYINPKPRRFHAIRHLKDAKVLVGDTIELEATFNSDILDDFLWYKSNRPLLLNERMIILNDKRMTTLSILCAKETDTGIYHVVCKSEFGVASSFASVMVINTDLVTLNTSEVAPSIDEPLPEELEVNEGEEARLMCKVTYDVNTIIQWSKNGIQLEENNNVATEYYNNRYTCLRIKNTCMKDAGEYTILMRDEITGHTDTSTCFLTINHSPTDTLNSVKLRTPLQPIVTCVGSKLSFNCSFILDDPKFYYVVWYIGHYRVERTNHRFQVICSGGDFFLFIKQIEPGMSGEVTCELRMALPTRKSLVINSTATNLTIVPSAVIDEVVKLNNITAGRNVYNIENSKLNIPVKNTKHFSNGIQKPKISTNGTKDHKEEMVITYCRLDDDNFYFDITNSDDEIKYFDFVSLYENCIFYEPSKSKSNVVIMEWCNTIANNIDFNESKKKWYKYEFKKTSDDFVEVGVSSIPMLEVKDPPLEQIMKFRITVVTEAIHNPNESRVCISPDVEELQKINKQCELKPMEEFNSIFTKTGDLIGCGAFGSVVLVRDNEGEFYAAKILKTRTQKKRDTAIREYEMMKRLRHPKLVELHSTFTAKESFILVMDYLWGGELFDRIVEEEHIKELDVVPYVRQICEALQYLHGYKIVHLDLKPENIICLSPNSRQVKIIDFGLARVLDESQMRAIYGTRDYVAPEVLNFEQLTLACDMWSLGVVTYMLLSGVMPFSGDSWPERSANITKAKYNYHESAFKDISDLAKDFVDHLLILQPEKRMKASDALNHRWIVDGPPKGAKAGHMKRTRQNLKSYLANNRARWQRAGNVMIAAHRLRNAGSQRNTLDADRMSPRVT